MTIPVFIQPKGVGKVSNLCENVNGCDTINLATDLAQNHNIDIGYHCQTKQCELISVCLEK